jgi:hypothetical protein
LFHAKFTHAAASLVATFEEWPSECSAACVRADCLRDEMNMRLWLVGVQSHRVSVVESTAFTRESNEVGQKRTALNVVVGAQNARTTAF